VAKGLILIADHDEAGVEPARRRLRAAGYDVVVVGDGAAAIAELHRVELDVAFVELALPGRGGLDVLSAAHHLSPDTEVVILDGRTDLATALECIRRGAFDLLAKPLDLDAMMLTVARGIERRSLRATTTLFRASQEILRTQDPAQLPGTIVELAARVLEADDVCLALADADGRMRIHHTHTTSPETRAAADAEVGEAVAARAAELGEPLLLPEDAKAGRLPGIDLRRVRTCIVFPLASGERRVGVLTLARVTDHRPYRRVDLERTGILASHALLAVENTALMHRMVEAERLATIGNLAAGVAHEINNPLTYVSVSASDALERMALLRTRAEAESADLAAWLVPALHEVEEALQDVSEGAQRIAAIARDLRALARPENPAREPLDLSEVIRSALRVSAAQLRARATVTQDLVEGAFVRGDEGRLVQVFINLMVNAVQAADARGAVAIHLTTSRVGDRIIATVHDDGPGIAPENLTRIFQPFFSTKATSGTGLGLSVSQSIVAEHGGTLSVTCEPGHGAKFVLSFPASAVARDGAGAADDKTRAA
jgi:two-component system, NtrC family, sensor kinase